VRERGPVDGSQFNDIGLMCDGAAAGMGIALVRLGSGAAFVTSVRQPTRPLPVLAHRHDETLGMCSVCRMAAKEFGLRLC